MSLYRRINSKSTPNGIFNRFWIYVWEFITVSKAQTWILCLYNSLGAVSVVPVISLVWRGCLFYASGLCSFWQTVRAFCQSLPGNHSYNKHQPFFFFFFSPARGPGLIPSRSPASSLPPGAWKRGQAQTNRNSNIYGSSPWALHLHSVTLVLTAPGLAGQRLCLRAPCCWNLPTSSKDSTAQEWPTWDNLYTISAVRLLVFEFFILKGNPNNVLQQKQSDPFILLMLEDGILNPTTGRREEKTAWATLNWYYERVFIITVLSASFAVRTGLKSLDIYTRLMPATQISRMFTEIKRNSSFFRAHKNVSADN